MSKNSCIRGKRLPQKMTKILKIGHRGAKGHLSENTIESFQMAIEMGCDGIEFDVHLSADGHVIVIHDATVDRTTNGNGSVKELTLSELKHLKIDGSFQISTLTEILDAIGGNKLINIELKVEATARPVVDIIENYVLEKSWNYDSFLVSSFDWNALKEIREWNSNIPLGVLTETNLDLAIAFSEFIKAETLHPYFHLLTSENTEQIRKKGIRVFPWTINEKADIEKIMQYHINGIITDFPERI